MTFPLTFALDRDYSVRAGANHQSGFAARVLGGQPPLCGFFTSVKQDTQFMGGSCGREKSLPVLARSANLHESAHPFCSGRAENINRFARSLTMLKASKGASAPAVKPSLKLAPVIVIRKTDLVHDDDVRECLSQLKSLMKSAYSGELHGLALIAAYKDDTFQVGASGMLNSNPIFTMGLIEVLKKDMLEKAEA